jgi:hypothetical protein
MGSLYSQTTKRPIAQKVDKTNKLLNYRELILVKVKIREMLLLEALTLLANMHRIKSVHNFCKVIRLYSKNRNGLKNDE